MSEEIKDKEKIRDEKAEAIGYKIGSFFAWTMMLCISALAVAGTVKVIAWMLL